MLFHEPSPNDRFFETPPYQRPMLDLGITPMPGQLPHHVRQHNDGAGQWFDLVLGLAMDGAARRGVDPKRVTEALETGRLLAHAHFILASDSNDYTLPSPEAHALLPDAQATFVGSVQTGAHSLLVSGGDPNRPLSMMSYSRRGDTYAPRTARIVRNVPNSSVETIDLPQPYLFDPLTRFPREPIPKQMWASYRLGVLASAATTALDAKTAAVRADVAIAFDDPQGPWSR